MFVGEMFESILLSQKQEDVFESIFRHKEHVRTEFTCYNGRQQQARILTSLYKRLSTAWKFCMGDSLESGLRSVHCKYVVPYPCHLPPDLL